MEPGLRKIIYFDLDAKQKKQKHGWENYRVQYLIFLVNTTENQKVKAKYI